MSDHAVDRAVWRRAQEMLDREPSEGASQERKLKQLTPQERAYYTTAAEQELRAEDLNQAQAAGSDLIRSCRRF